MDLSKWLEAARGPLLKAAGHLVQTHLSLWEGGVRLDLHGESNVVGLKFRTRDGGPSFAQTTSTAMSVDLSDGATLDRPTERVIRALIRALHRVDKGQVEVPKAEVEEDAPDEAVVPAVDVGEAHGVTPPRDMHTLQLACVADQRAMLQSWREQDTPLVHLEGDGLCGGRTLEAALGHAREAGSFVLDVRHGTVAAGLAVVAAGQVVAVYARPDQASAFEGPVYTGASSPGARTVAPWHALPSGPAVAVSGSADEPYDVVAARLRAHGDVSLAGLPRCVAPELARAPIHAAAWGADPGGTVQTPACALCDVRQTCVGLSRGMQEAFGMRGIRPLFLED